MTNCSDPVSPYIPSPADTSSIALPDSLIEMREEIARNVYEVWAKGRFDEGWRYGSVKDEKTKQTPMMIPYEQLPESEKVYDRRTAMETLRLIVSHGYRIVKD